MHPVTQTTLLLMLVIFGSVVSAASTGRAGIVAGAFVAGMACGRIVRIVRAAAP